MPFGRGFWGWSYPYNPWSCQWFPWLPRWWWTGMYGQGSVPYVPTPYVLTPQQESEILKSQVEMLKEEIGFLNERVKEIENGLKELEAKGEK